jgi:hypothetical protein
MLRLTVAVKLEAVDVTAGAEGESAIGAGVLLPETHPPKKILNKAADRHLFREAAISFLLASKVGAKPFLFATELTGFCISACVRINAVGAAYNT